MKRIVAIIAVVVFALCMTSVSFAGVEKCEKCHKGEKTIDKLAERNKLATAEELTTLLKTGKKAGMHKTMGDDDIKAAAEKLNLK